MPSNTKWHNMAAPLMHSGLSKVPTKFHFKTFLAIVSLPIVLCAFLLLVLVHDLVDRSVLVDEPLAACPGWEHSASLASNSSSNFNCPRMGWPYLGGLIMQWLASEYKTGLINCHAALRPETVWVYLLVTPPCLAMVSYSAFKARHLSKSTSIIMSLTNDLFRRADEASGELTKCLAQDFCTDILRSRRQHIAMLALFQVVLGLVFFMSYSMTCRLFIAYQVLWLALGTGIVLVRPAAVYAVWLSQAMIDEYVRRLLAGRKAADAVKWSELAVAHRDLELSISRLWIHVNAMVLVPSTPYLVFAVHHLVFDESLQLGAFVALFFFLVALFLFISIITPVAHISSMFNSQNAYRGKHEHWDKRSKMSIAATVRGFVRELPGRSSQQDIEYLTFLEYVQGFRYKVHIGIPKVYMVGIDKGFVSKFLSEFAIKLPLFVSAFVALRKY